MKCRPCRECGEDNLENFYLYPTGKPYPTCKKCYSSSTNKNFHIRKSLPKTKKEKRVMPDNLRLAFWDFVADVAEEAQERRMYGKKTERKFTSTFTN